MEETIRKEIIEKILEELPSEKITEVKGQLEALQRKKFKQSMKAVGMLIGIAVVNIIGFKLIWNFGFAATFRLIPEIGWSQAISLVLSIPFGRWLSHFFQVTKVEKEEEKMFCVQCPMMDEQGMMEPGDVMGPPLLDKDNYYG